MLFGIFWEPTGRAIVQLVFHSTGSGEAPFHSTDFSRMLGGPLPDLELQDTPRLCPHYSHENFRRPPDSGYHRKMEDGAGKIWYRYKGWVGRQRGGGSTRGGSWSTSRGATTGMTTHVATTASSPSAQVEVGGGRAMRGIAGHQGCHGTVGRGGV